MATFESLKAKALDLAQVGAAKAKELTDVAKMNIEISSEEEAVRKAYIDIGKLYYAEHGMAPAEPYAALCEKVTAAKQQIEAHKAKIAEMKAAGNSKDDTCTCGCESDAVVTDVPQEEAAPKDDDTQL